MAIWCTVKGFGVWLRCGCVSTNASSCSGRHLEHLESDLELRDTEGSQVRVRRTQLCFLEAVGGLAGPAFTRSDEGPSHWPRTLDSLASLKPMRPPGLPSCLRVAATSEWPRPACEAGSGSQGAIRLGEGLDPEPAGGSPLSY